jgi:hypothetical protein
LVLQNRHTLREINVIVTGITQNLHGLLKAMNTSISGITVLQYRNTGVGNDVLIIINIPERVK